VRRLLVPLLSLFLLLAACVPIQPPAQGSTPAPAAAAEETVEGTPLPFDPAVRTGTLANGLQWYIRPNSEPPGRAELWLAINAGSNNEEEDQRGLAHFLEHMLFNGTASYPENELIDFLESIGMEFGPDVNAYTSFDETVYTLQVPTDDPETVATAMHVLREWAADATIDPVEVDKERGVVVEEWRMRDLNAQGRVQDEIIDAILAGSRYAERLPIGEMEIVRNAPPERVRAFYETWYRPDNMAVIAVGDFTDLDAIQALIEQEFGPLQNPAAPLERQTWSVPDYGDTSVRVITDPELTGAEINVIFKQDPMPGRVENDLRDSLIAQTAVQALNYRFDEIRQGSNPPFLYAVSAVQPFVRSAGISILYASVEQGGAAAGLESLMTEAERLRRYGITAAEFERARTDILRSLQSAADEAQNIPHRNHADALLNHFLIDDMPVSAEDSYTLAQALYPTISVDEVNAVVAKLFPTANRIALFVAPEDPDVTLPTADELAAVITAAEAADIEAPVEAEAAGPLMAEAPAPADIVATETLTDLGVTVVTFANGLELWLKPTDFKDDEVLFQLVSPGGVSNVDDDLAAEATWVTNLVSQSGVGTLDQTALQRALTGQNVFVSPFIGDGEEGLSGSASPQDLETLFQLAYLYATQPRLDPEPLSLFVRQVDAFLLDRSNQPESLLSDRLTEIQCGEENARCSFLDSLAEVPDFDIDQMLELYRTRFGDFGDSKAILVGAFDPDEALALAQRYLGTLPADGRSEAWQDLVPSLVGKSVSEDLFKGIDPRSYVYLSWQVPFTPTVEGRVAVRALEGVVDTLVREDLREERAGIYGAGVSVSPSGLPGAKLGVSIQFTTEPTRVVELVDAVQAILDGVRNEGPDADVLERVRQQLLSDHEENLQLNDAWLTWLSRYVVDQEGPPSDLLRIQAALESVTAADVQALAQLAIPEDAGIRLVLYPDGFTPPAAP